MRLQETESDHLVFESTATCKCYNQCVLAEVWELFQCVCDWELSNFLYQKEKNFFFYSQLLERWGWNSNNLCFRFEPYTHCSYQWIPFLQCGRA